MLPLGQHPARESSPELRRNTETNSFTESTISPQGLPPVGPSRMSLAEKKRMQWEKEKSQYFVTCYITMVTICFSAIERMIDLKPNVRDI